MRQLHSSNIHLYYYNNTATTEIYTLSLHDALPISKQERLRQENSMGEEMPLRPFFPVQEEVRRMFQELIHQPWGGRGTSQDRKSTRLNSSHRCISYAVFCLKKKKKNTKGFNAHNGT